MTHRRVCGVGSMVWCGSIPHITRVKKESEIVVAGELPVYKDKGFRVGEKCHNAPELEAIRYKKQTLLIF